MALKNLFEVLNDYFFENTKIDKDNHSRYSLLDGTYLSSPSQFLEPISNSKYKDIPAFVLEKAAEQGKIIHQLVQNYFEIGEFPEADNINTPKLIEAAKAVVEIFKKEELEYIASEVPILNIKAKYYGFIDFIVFNKRTNYYEIIELKTRSKIDRSDLMSEILQITFYQNAIYESTKDIVNCNLLIINKNKPSEYLFEKINRTFEAVDAVNHLAKIYWYGKEKKTWAI